MKHVLVALTAVTFTTTVAAVTWLSQKQAAPETQISVLEQSTDVYGQCQFVPGDHTAFRLISEVTAEGQTDRFAGIMSWEVESVNFGVARIRAVFNELTLTQALALPEERAASPEGVPFFLEVGRNCAIVTKAFAPQWDTKTRMLVSTQLDNFSFELPTTGVTTWNTESLDGLGDYTASFTLASTSPLLIQRKKSSHLPRGGGDIFGIKIKLGKAEAMATFDESLPLWWQSVAGQEQVTIQAPGHPVVSMTQNFKLERVAGQFFAVPMLAWDEAEVTDPYDVTAEFSQPATQHQSYNEAHTAFDRAINQASPDYYEAALQLGAWLREHPEDVALVVAELRGTLDDKSRAAAFLALELSDSEAARIALTGMIDDFALSEVDQARAASALSDVGEPTREVADVLLTRANTKDMAGRVAILAVGSMVPRIEDTQLHDHVVNALNDRLGVAVSNSDVLLVLDAIGNTQDSEFIDVLTVKVAEDSRATRRHAANALAKLPADTAKPVLLARLSEESDPRVSTTLIKALTDTGVALPEVVSVLDQRLVNANDNERVAIVDLLGLQENDEAQQVLVKQFKRETNVRIQQQIGRYVSAEALR